MKEKARSWGLEMETKLRRDPHVGRMKFAEWHQKWWNARVVEPHTLRGDASSIKNHITPYWGRLGNAGHLPH
ncbi:hypothetical protein [Streptomyces sp. NPDC020141]|uniref:hypothetical protein n=1 Tax=Streptomyces sp. NPDC020141 TaxID=3365065 RepID=UPI0037B02D5C